MHGANQTLRERVEAERAALFTGRARELGRLDALLDRDSSRMLAYVYGPGGIGKTEILRELARRSRTGGLRPAFVDGSAIPANPIAFRTAFGRALVGSDVVFVDGFEYLARLTSWLWDEFLFELPTSARVVIAGRERPAPQLFDPAWRELSLVVELGIFSREESLAYLERRRVPADRREWVHAAIGGHPLALALVGDLAAQSGAETPRFDEMPEVVQALLSRLLRDLPSREHRRALWSAAIVRELTEDLLTLMLDVPDASALYQWLSTLTCMRFEARGLAPHDILRRLLMADLRWRDPSSVRDLRRCAANYYVGRLDAVHWREAVFDLAYALRGSLLFHEDGVDPGYYFVADVEEDWPAIEAMTLRHEGPTSLDYLRFWRGRGGICKVVRGPDQSLAGYAMTLHLHEIDPADAQRDPGVASVYDRLVAEGLVGEPSYYNRFWMASDAHQHPSPAVSAFYALSIEFLFENQVRILVATSSCPDALLGLAAAGIYQRLSQADFEIDGRRNSVFWTKFIDESARAWVRRYVQILVGAPADRLDERSPVPLDRRAFNHEVRRALRVLDRPDLLAKSQLIGTRLVRTSGADSPLEAARSLQAILREQSRMFLASPKDARYYRVLDVSYFELRTKQLEAADVMGLSFGTYRRTLDTAIRRLADALWQRADSG